MKKLTAFVAVVALAALATSTAQASERVRSSNSGAQTSGGDLLSSDSREPLLITRVSGLVVQAMVMDEASGPKVSARNLQFEALSAEGMDAAWIAGTASVSPTRRNLVFATFDHEGNNVVVHADGSR